MAKFTYAIIQEDGRIAVIESEMEGELEEQGVRLALPVAEWPYIDSMQAREAYDAACGK